MLAADKLLLDAQLRNDLQNLRQLEITNVVQRFQSALTPATLIAGFSFTSIIELDFTSGVQGLDELNRGAEPIFYVCASAALSLALYVTAVASTGIVFGQRLTIQATATQGSEHDALVRELNQKFVLTLIALGGSMICVVVASVAVIWVKDPIKGKHVSITSTCICAALFLFTVFSMCQMFARLHTWQPANSRLALRAGRGKSFAGAVDEFYVGNEPLVAGQQPPPPQLPGGSADGMTFRGGGPAGQFAAAREAAGQPRPDERTNLLCLGRDSKV